MAIWDSTTLELLLHLDEPADIVNHSDNQEKKVIQHKEPSRLSGPLKLKLWSFAHGFYNGPADNTWFMSSTVVRRDGEGSVLVSCSPLLCFLKEPRTQNSSCLAACPA